MLLADRARVWLLASMIPHVIAPSFQKWTLARNEWGSAQTSKTGERAADQR